MTNTLRYAAVAAALLAGTAAAHAQVYVAPDYAPAPVVVAPGPAPAIVAPAPGVIVAEPPMAAEIVTAPVIAAPPAVVAARRETVGETVIERLPPERHIIHRHARTTRVHLTHAQRRDVVRTIRYERPAPVVRESTAAVSYTVGSVLPRSIPVYSMPRDVVYEAPALRGYEYTTVGDRVLLVDPASSTVVDTLY